MNFVCIAPFGDYSIGDIVPFPEGESPAAAFFAPAPEAPPIDPGPITPPVSS